MGSIIIPSWKGWKDQMTLGTSSNEPGIRLGLQLQRKTGWLKALQLLTATILHLNHKIILPGWHVRKYFLKWKHNVNRDCWESKKKRNCCFLGYYMEILHLHRKYFSKKRHRVTAWKKWSHQIRQVLWKRGKGSMAFAAGKIWWDSGLLWMHGSVRFCCGTKVWVLPKAGGFQALG